MTDDIVARLRGIEGGYNLRNLFHQAADEIERLRGEVKLLRAGGCARDQTTTQFCAEAERLRSERDEARRQTRRILNEIDCRIEHGAESNGHLEAIRNLFEEATDGK